MSYEGLNVREMISEIVKAFPGVDVQVFHPPYRPSAAIVFPNGWCVTLAYSSGTMSNCWYCPDPTDSTEVEVAIHRGNHPDDTFIYFEGMTTRGGSKPLFGDVPSERVFQILEWVAGFDPYKPEGTQVPKNVY